MTRLTCWDEDPHTRVDAAITSIVSTRVKTLDKDWHETAGCHGTTEPEDWFFGDTSSAKKATAAHAARMIGVCRSCPVSLECLVATLRAESGTPAAMRYGIFAGLTPTARVAVTHGVDEHHRVPVPTVDPAVKTWTRRKKCTGCQETLAFDLFARDRGARDGRTTRCKACLRKTYREKKQAVDTPDEKECTRCHETKPSGEFQRESRRHDGLTAWCKTCCSRRRRELADAKHAGGVL